MCADILEKLNSNTIKVDDCWLWQGSIKNFYGRVWYNGRDETVHRVSAHLFLNYDLDSVVLQVNHQTFCPNKTCWNPEHLYVGSQKSNVRDNDRDQIYHNSLKTHCKNGHIYSKENTIYNSRGSRECKMCKRKHGREYKDRRSNESTKGN